MSAVVLALAAGLFAWTASWIAQPTETLLEDLLTPTEPLSAAIEVSNVPTVVAIEISQVLRPVRDLVTSSVTMYLLRTHDSPTATAPAFEPLLEMQHEFTRTAERASMTFTMHATITEPGRYHLDLARLDMSFPEAGTPVRVRVGRIRASAAPFEAGSVVLTVMAVATTLVAAIASAVQLVARLRREEASAPASDGETV